MLIVYLTKLVTNKEKEELEKIVRLTAYKKILYYYIESKVLLLVYYS